MISIKENIYEGAIREMTEIIKRNLIKLKDSERDTIEEVFFKGKNITQVSKDLKVSRSCINYRLKKGMENLKQLIVKEIGIKNVERLIKATTKPH
jgi:DNA-directed RNA polymerase specialized sigma subunit